MRCYRFAVDRNFDSLDLFNGIQSFGGSNKTALVVEIEGELN